MGEFGKTVQTESQLWGTFLLKTERATEQAKEEKKVNDLIRITKENAATQPPGDWKDPNDPSRTMGYYDRLKLVREELSGAADRQLQGIPDRVVRQRMAASIQTKLTAAMSNIQPILQRQYLDYAKTEILKSHKENLERISMMPEGKLKEQAVADAQNRVKYIEELFPLIPKEWVWKSQTNFKSDLGAHTLRRQFTKIKTHEDAVAWLDQLDNPKRGTTLPQSHYNDVKRLNERQRTLFIERLQRRAARLSAAESSAANSQIRLDAFKFKQGLNANYQRYHQNIMAVTAATLSGYGPEDSAWPKDKQGNPLKVITAHDILVLPDSEIDANKKDSLIKIINQEGLVVDRKALFRHSQEIREAFNEEELRRVEASIDRKVENDTLSGGTYDSLRRLIDNRRGKTPGYKEQKVYGKLLNEIMNKAGVTVDMFTKAMGADATERARQGDATSVAAKMKFSRLIQEGARPVEAFYETIETFVLDQKLLAGNVLKILDREMLDGVDDDVIKDVGKLTKEHVDKIRENFRAHARGRKVAKKIPKEITVGLSKEEMAERQRKNIISFDQRKTMRELIKIERAIDYLHQYAPMPKEPPPSNVEFTKPGSKEEKKGVFDKIQDWLSPKPGARADRSDESFTSGGPQ